jgi:glycosyltransferase involved in cell wall biosynthesis
MVSIKISIILPVFNGELYLGQCLDSLVNQTFSDIEILVLNDGSTDNSAIISESYASKDYRVNVIHKTNSGLSDTRNVGIGLAKGEYIMFVDADDWIDHETCEIVYKTAKETNVDIILWSYVREHIGRSIKKFIDIETGYYDRNKLETKLQRRMVGLFERELRFPQNADAISVVWSKLYKSCLLKENREIRFIDTNIIGSAGDALFNLYAFGKAKDAFYLNEYFTHYRRYNECSFTNSYKSWLFDRRLNLFNYMEEYIKNNNLPDVFYKALDNRRCLSIIGLGLTELSQANPKSSLEKIAYLKKIFKTPSYKKAFKKLELKYFPAHWFVFFFFCKKSFATVVYLMLKAIKYFKRII